MDLERTLQSWSILRADGTIEKGTSAPLPVLSNGDEISVVWSDGSGFAWKPGPNIVFGEPDV